MSNFYELKSKKTNTIIRLDSIVAVKRDSSDPFAYYVWVIERKDCFDFYFESQKDVDDFLDKVKKAMDNG